MTALAKPELRNAINAELSHMRLTHQENLLLLTFNPGKRARDKFHDQLLSDPLLEPIRSDLEAAGLPVELRHGPEQLGGVKMFVEPWQYEKAVELLKLHKWATNERLWSRCVVVSNRTRSLVEASLGVLGSKHKELDLGFPVSDWTHYHLGFVEVPTKQAVLQEEYFNRGFGEQKSFLHKGPALLPKDQCTQSTEKGINPRRWRLVDDDTEGDRSTENLFEEDEAAKSQEGASSLGEPRSLIGFQPKWMRQPAVRPSQSLPPTLSPGSC